MQCVCTSVHRSIRNTGRRGRGRLHVGYEMRAGGRGWLCIASRTDALHASLALRNAGCWGQDLEGQKKGTGRGYSLAGKGPWMSPLFNPLHPSKQLTKFFRLRNCE